MSPHLLTEAVKTLQKHQGPASPEAIPVYERLGQAVLARSASQEKEGDHEANVAALRDCFYRLGTQYRTQRGLDDKLLGRIETVLMATHYQSLLYAARSLGLKDIYAKCAVTLLKYPTAIPQDKALYQAGNAAREQGNNNLAFMLLNRYVDVAEAIDSGAPDSRDIDATDYQSVDAMPLDGPVPATHYLEEEDDREDIRTWVLSVVTDSNIEQRFPPREQARSTLYEGLFSSDRATCIVTGYPIYPADLLEINHSTANRKDWNAYVSKTKVCPWTGAPQTPLF